MTPAEVAAACGLTGYACEGEGIGGLLKTRFEDFRVEEVGSPPALDKKGRFTVVKVTLTNWETNRFFGKLARNLGISKNRIWFSGTKDKRAVTTQLVVIDAPQNKVAEIDMPDAEIEILGRSHQKLKFGDHTGNRFTITVRGCADADGNPLDAKTAIERVNSLFEGMQERLGKNRFPNWIGPQRFGATRPVTPVVGRAVVNDEWENAVNEYLGMAGLNQTEEVEKFRETWRNSKDVEKCLEIIPKHLGFERDLLNHLQRRPGDWIGAFKKLPKSLQIMTVHSLQSQVFNRIIGARLSAGLTLSSPVEGDVVGIIQDSGKIDMGKLAEVEEEIIERMIRNCKLGRLAVTGALPGSESIFSNGKPGLIEKEVLEKMDLASQDWIVDGIPRLTSKGSRRPLTVPFFDFSVEEAGFIEASRLSSRMEEGPREGELWNQEGCSIRLRFTLPSGTYATVLMREFMRAPLSQY
ncbi:MAG: tRNA pseudouridine(13) synthase TruD [Candidatus Thalassarchaeaceae archaeon]|jgi:tRNA pseudouridine13 synthase|nr:tRNA pseudouridine(13) synthase TruD [Candidatus Thalassarchaeaceae archaeon]